jgi:hypothetical protein
MQGPESGARRVRLSRPACRSRLALIVCVLVLTGIAPPGLAAQEAIDAAYRPRIQAPTYPVGAGPVVLVDAGHNTFHARDQHFEQLAHILEQDGYRVRALREAYSAPALAGADVLVVVNALADRDIDNWVLPTSPAFTPEEVSAVRAWVEKGGSLLLVADHMPFPGAAADLGRAFDVEFMNGFAIVEAEWEPLVFRRVDATLRAHPITDGRRAEERVDAVVTFVAGQAFRATHDRVAPLLVFGAGVVSINMARAWEFDDATPRVPVEGWLQGAAVEAGAGRVAIFGEAAMFAAQLVGPRRRPVGMNAPAASQNLQFLLNTLRWLSRAPGIEAAASAERSPLCPGVPGVRGGEPPHSRLRRALGAAPSGGSCRRLDGLHRRQADGAGKCVLDMLNVGADTR